MALGDSNYQGSQTDPETEDSEDHEGEGQTEESMDYSKFTEHGSPLTHQTVHPH